MVLAEIISVGFVGIFIRAQLASYIGVEKGSRGPDLTPIGHVLLMLCGPLMTSYKLPLLDLTNLSSDPADNLFSLYNGPGTSGRVRSDDVYQCMFSVIVLFFFSFKILD